jgi:hypothetical protein
LGRRGEEEERWRSRYFFASRVKKLGFYPKSPTKKSDAYVEEWSCG